MADSEYQLGNVIFRSNFLKKTGPEPYIISELPLVKYRDGTKYESIPITDDRLTQMGLVKNLVITCIDQRPDFKFDSGKLEEQFSNIFYSNSPDSKDIHFVL